MYFGFPIPVSQETWGCLALHEKNDIAVQWNLWRGDIRQDEQTDAGVCAAARKADLKYMERERKKVRL